MIRSGSFPFQTTIVWWILPGEYGYWKSSLQQLFLIAIVQHMSAEVL